MSTFSTATTTHAKNQPKRRTTKFRAMLSQLSSTEYTDQMQKNEREKKKSSTTKTMAACAVHTMFTISNYLNSSWRLHSSVRTSHDNVDSMESEWKWSRREHFAGRRPRNECISMSDGKQMRQIQIHNRFETARDVFDNSFVHSSSDFSIAIFFLLLLLLFSSFLRWLFVFILLSIDFLSTLRKIHDDGSACKYKEWHWTWVNSKRQWQDIVDDSFSAETIISSVIKSEQENGQRKEKSKRKEEKRHD